MSRSCQKRWHVCAIALLLVGATAALVGCGSQNKSNEVTITKQDFGEDWPFTVDEGVLAGNGSDGFCEVLFTTGGVTYAVNGTAKATGQYADINEIWADDPSTPGLSLKVSMGPVIDRGLELCD